MIDVRDPRTGERDYGFEPPDRTSLARMASAARSAGELWAARSPGERASILLRLRETLEAHRGEILEALIRDTGRRTESHLEFDAVLGMLTRWAGIGAEQITDERSRPASVPGFSVAQGSTPYGLVAVVSPWNFPLLLACIDAIPALLAGCAVLVKPSEITPRYIDPMNEAIGAIDELSDVFRFVAGAGETGETLIELSDLVCFTGSVTTGKRVAVQAARLFIPSFLELGGKDPAIVCDDADLDRATSAILWGGTANAGQSCLSIERVYVDENVYDRFLELLVQKASEVTLAAPGMDDGMLGPIIAARQVEVIERHLEDALAKGAAALTGGRIERIGGGAYLRPTILVDVDHGMLVMREETFGPVLPVMSADGDDELVRLANDSNYGLSAAVFSSDPERAATIAARVRAGAVSINDAALTALIYDAEKQSFGDSGLGGSRMGPSSLRRFLRSRAYLTALTEQPDPWWFPHLR